MSFYVWEVKEIGFQSFVLFDFFRETPIFIHHFDTSCRSLILCLLSLLTNRDPTLPSTIPPHKESRLVAPPRFPLSLQVKFFDQNPRTQNNIVRNMKNGWNIHKNGWIKIMLLNFLDRVAYGWRHLIYYQLFLYSFKSLNWTLLNRKPLNRRFYNW